MCTQAFVPSASPTSSPTGISCSLGKFQFEGECFLCQRGSYSPVSGATSCLLSPPGLCSPKKYLKHWSHLSSSGFFIPTVGASEATMHCALAVLPGAAFCGFVGNVVTTFAGNGSMGSSDGARAVSTFSSVNGVLDLPSGVVLVLDGNIIRIVTSTGTIFLPRRIFWIIRCSILVGVMSTLAGRYTGYLDGQGTVAQFNILSQIALDPSSGIFYIAEVSNHAVRQMTPTGVIVFTINRL